VQPWNERRAVDLAAAAGPVAEPDDVGAALRKPSIERQTFGVVDQRHESLGSIGVVTHQDNKPPAGSQSTRAVCIVCDECQHLMTEDDALFVTTARSSRTSAVYATQSVATLLEAFGGHGAESRMQSFLGNTQLQIHHQQSDTRTISYLQELTGNSLRHFVSSNTSRGQDWLGPLMGDASSGSAGISESYEFDLQASDLNSLAKGGPPHFYTEAIVYMGGRVFASGKTWSRARFPQQGAPKHRKRR